MVAEPGEDGLVTIVLIFAGDMALQLRARGIAATLCDFGEPCAGARRAAPRAGGRKRLRWSPASTTGRPTSKRASPGWSASGARRRMAVRGEVEAILARVEAEGDAALLEYTARFDRQQLSSRPAARSARTRSRAPWRAVRRSCARRSSWRQRASARFTAASCRRRSTTRTSSGVGLGLRWRPIAAVGIYVPGGTAAYPSSVLMNALPARIAGVERLVMTVPAPGGELNPLVLVAAHLAGVDEIYRVGGAQAIAALAFGTATIAAVDKIVGPGNAYVAEAKRQVFGRVGIDLIAGPSEIVVVADGAQDPAWIAADLLSQAEHDALAQAVLITDNAALADAVAAAVERQLAALPRQAIARASWRDFGAIVVVPDLGDAPALVDRLAPEHVELLVAAAAAPWPSASATPARSSSAPTRPR